MLTLVLQLFPSNAQLSALLETMHAFNAAASDIVSVAFDRQTGSRVALERLVYGRVRKEFGLPAQLAVGAIGKASAAYKAFGRTEGLPVLQPEGAVMYDRRVMRVQNLSSVSITTMQGRILIPFVICGYQHPRLHAHPEVSYLLLRGGTFYLAVTLEVPGTADWIAQEEIVAIDLGMQPGGDAPHTRERPEENHTAEDTRAAL